jgi:F-type H+-transporting ATPase subunit a
MVGCVLRYDVGLGDRVASDNLFHHAQDSPEFELLWRDPVHLPSFPIPQWLADLLGRPEATFQITKYMVLELVAAALLLLVFIPLSRRAQHQKVPTGRFWNFFEAIVVFIRDQVARQAIGSHDGDRFVPFLLTAFLFILFCNLLGLVPFAGSATASISVTGAMAACTFVVVLASGMRKLGLVGFWKALVPHMELHPLMAILLVPLIFGLEVLGLAIRHTVLSVRLFANIFAGHTVLTAIMMVSVIALAEQGRALTYFVAPITVLGVVALSLLELFVAFLQAYIFAFLSALFIGMAIHPH